MKKFIKLSFLLFATFIISCKSTEQMSEKVMEEYKQKGYHIGVIEPKSNGNCQYSITIQGSNEQFDPVNIEDPKFAQILSKKTIILFKFLMSGGFVYLLVYF